MNAEPRRPLLWWDVAVAALLAFQGVLGVLEAPGWAADRAEPVRIALVLAPLALIGALYLALGRRVLPRGMRDEPLGAAGAAFLGLLAALLALATFCTPLHAILQALVYPMIWTAAARYRDAVLWCAATALGIGVSMFLGLGGTSAAFASAAISAPISFVFSVVMGTWITRIAAQGERYRELSETLRASQGEVAALSEAAGAAAERERLSRELHDTLTQTLTGLVMLSEQAERALAAGDAERAADRLARVSIASREAMTEARALVATTQPLGDGGLAQAIQRVADRLRRDTGLRVGCELDGSALGLLSGDRELEVVVLRAVQEGLANARKHAQARAVAVSLGVSEPAVTALPRLVVLRIEDDGIGFDPEQVIAAASFGLSGLVERVRAAGGEVGFGRGPVRGAVLEVHVPVEAPRSSDEGGRA